MTDGRGTGSTTDHGEQVGGGMGMRTKNGRHEVGGRGSKLTKEGRLENWVA